MMGAKITAASCSFRARNALQPEAKLANERLLQYFPCLLSAHCSIINAPLPQWLHVPGVTLPRARAHAAPSLVPPRLPLRSRHPRLAALAHHFLRSHATLLCSRPPAHSAVCPASSTPAHCLFISVPSVFCGS